MDPQLEEYFRNLLGMGAATPPGAVAPTAPVDPTAPTAPAMAQLSPDAFVPPPRPQIAKPRDQYDLGPAYAEQAAAGDQLRWAQNLSEQADAGPAKLANEQMQQAGQGDKADFEAEAKRREKRQGELQGQADSIRSQFRSFGNEQVNPHEYFEQQGTWGNIAMGLAMAISGYLHPRGENLAMSYVERAIEKNIAMQEARLNRKGRALAAESDMLSQDQTAEERLHQSAEWKRGVSWEIVSRQIKMESERVTDDQGKARAEVMLKKAEKETADAAVMAATKQADMALKKYQAGSGYYAASEATKREGMSQAGQLQRQRERVIADQTAEVFKAPLRQYDAETKRQASKAKAGGTGSSLRPLVDPNTQDVIGYTYKDTWTEGRKRMEGHANLRANMDMIRDISGDVGFWEGRTDILNLGSEKIHELDSLWADMITQIKITDGYGANFTAAEQALIERQVGKGPDTWTQKDYMERVAIMRKVRGDAYQRFMRAILKDENGDPMAPPELDDQQGGGDAFDQAPDLEAPQGL